jgi:hypothetical protein
LNGEQNPTGSAKRVFKSNQYTNDKTYGKNTTTSSLGRFPANLIHDDSDEVLELFPNTKSQGHWSKTKTTGFGEFGNGKSEYLGVGEKDKEGGSASRFFYCAKCSKSERNKGCEGYVLKEGVSNGVIEDIKKILC